MGSVVSGEVVKKVARRPFETIGTGNNWSTRNVVVCDALAGAATAIVRGAQGLVAPKHVSRAKRYFSTWLPRFALAEIPEIKLTYRPDALIHGVKASELAATPVTAWELSNAVEGVQPSGAVAPKQVSRMKTLVLDFDGSVTRLEAAD